MTAVQIAESSVARDIALVIVNVRASTPGTAVQFLSIDGAADVVNVLRECITRLEEKPALKSMRQGKLSRVIDLVTYIRRKSPSKPSACSRRVSLARVLVVMV
jgi:hypothetical protein